MSESVRRPARTFLFLQGLASAFFADLADELARRGHLVHRINFNGGDRLFWRRPGAVDFRRGLEAWPAFLNERLEAWGVTDVLLFGDSRPLHAAAAKVVWARGLRLHVVDEGYIRPNCITLEDDGVNGHSALPKDPAWYRREAAKLPEWDGGPRHANSFARRAAEDVAYTVDAVALAPLYPRYRTHRPAHPLREYLGWVARFASGPRDRRRSRARIAALEASGAPYHLFPLQLDSDTQIRLHSPFGRMKPAIEAVIASFAAHAPKGDRLVIKEHPLDNRLIPWGRVIAARARAHGVADRVVFIEDAPLDGLLQNARSVVNVNSTTGVLALGLEKPVKALGSAIYDLPELTFQGTLDAFWTEGARPDAETFDAFRRVVKARTQIVGSFFGAEGLQAAVCAAADRLELAPTAVALPQRRLRVEPVRQRRALAGAAL